MIPDVQERMCQRRFTRRMQEVSWCLLAGMSNAEAADALFISESSIKSHVTNIARCMDIEAGDNGTRVKIVLTLLGMDATDFREHVARMNTWPPLCAPQSSPARRAQP